MRMNSTRRTKQQLTITLLLVCFFVLLLPSAKAQQLAMRDFVLYGSNSTQIGTSTVINGGRVGSNKLVTSIGNTTINAIVNSEGLVQLSNSNTVKGTISAKGVGSTSGTTLFSTGSNFSSPNIGDSINVNGNVNIQSGSIAATVFLPSSATYTVPKGTKVNTQNKMRFPVMPALPNVIKFPDYTTDNINSTRILNPNTSYGNLVLDGAKTATFAGTGVYTFKSIKISNADNKFILDFGGNTTGFIVIQVHGDVDLDKLNVQIVNGGDASRVYMEVHGTGATSPTGTDAWRIANGSSGSTQGIWYGAVFAPYGGIFVGQGSSPSKIQGALWSGTNVSLASGVSVTYVAPAPCPTPVADAGPEKTFTCPETQASIGTTNSSLGSGFTYKWTTVVNNKETVVNTTDRVITVSKPGTYTLTVTSPCGQTATSSVLVKYVSCVVPINQINTGKVDNIIGHELTYLAANLDEAKKHLVLVGNDSVMIEAVAVVTREQDAKTYLEGLGLTNIIPNGRAYQIISGQFPIAKLNEINLRPDLINYCRPIFKPLGNSGIVTSEGDKAIAANFARGGFSVDGKGIKVGVISDSYDRVEPGVRARQDERNGDVPGPSNPEGHLDPVQIIGAELPKGTDEGRAMAGIIHDLAPGAKLAFRTGFNSAGDFANGIIQLKDAGCNVIVDDVTYITEPFFRDGVVSAAVNEVRDAGVAYFTSAGNFGQKSYTSRFNRSTVAVPDNIANYAHDFGNGTGDIYQRLKLKSGTYTIMLQWVDDFYSLAQTTGTLNDLDIYLVDAGGRIGFNRNNLHGDPFEVLSFSINLPDPNQEIPVDLLITKANSSLASEDPLFKYVIFRGNAVIDEYYSNQPIENRSTIIGQANAEGAITVGAVLFSNTPPYGNLPSIASFSSTGGTPVYASGNTTPNVRLKPDLTAPNGVNTSTTVVMGPDIDFVGSTTGKSDGFPNFFGTSASAPHAAAAAALVLEAKRNFYNDQQLTPTELRTILHNTAISMQPDGIGSNGWNYIAGKGLVQPYGAIRTFANPKPEIDKLVYASNIVPGTTEFTLTVTGNYLTEDSKVYFRGAPLETVPVDDHTVKTTIPQFNTGNPAINVYTPSFPGATGDGGLSNTLYFFSAAKLKVTIQADRKSIKYGEKLPPPSSTVFVEGDSLNVYNQKHNTNLTRTSLGVDESQIQYRYTDPTVNPLSDVGPYRLNVTRKFSSTNTTDVGLLEVYQYDSLPGSLQINKMPVTVSPTDRVVTYGDVLNNVQYTYTFDPTAQISNRDSLIAAISAAHAKNIDPSVLGVMNSVGGTAAVFYGNQILSVYKNASIVYQNKLYPVLVNGNGAAIVLINNTSYPVTNRSDGSAFVNVTGTECPLVNGSGAVVIFNGTLYPVFNSTRTGSAVVLINGTEYPVVNGTGIKAGTAVVIINGTEYSVINGVGGAVVIINGQYYPIVNGTGIKAGTAVVIINGTEYSVVNGTGIKAGTAVVIINGVENSVVNAGGSAGVFLNGQYYDVQTNATGGASIILNGTATAVPYLNGVGGGAATIINGEYYPIVNGTGIKAGTAVVIINGTEYSVVNGTGIKAGTAVVIINGTDYPVVNSISPTTLANMSTAATLNAIANARVVNTVANKFIDVSANAFVQFNSNSGQSTMLNTFAGVNRTLVDANRLANGEPVLVNTTKGSALTILNSSPFLNSKTLSNPSNQTPVILDQADVDNATNTATVSINGINMITGTGSGTQYVIPATLFSPNFDILYKAGTVVINKSPLGLQANNLSKDYGEAINISQSNFKVVSGNTKYTDNIALAAITSQGAMADAAVGNYSLLISNAMGGYGTDVSNYNVAYTAGNLSVTSKCPVITHSANSNFVSTPASPVSLWLNLQIKVRGQLAKDGDSIVFRAGRLALQNVTYQNATTDISVPRGVVIAVAGIPAPISRFDETRGVFITQVPVGYSSTADVFITGALINSATGFIKGKNSGSALSGILQSNVVYSGQWNYSMAAYTAANGPIYVQYLDLKKDGDVVAVSGSSNKAGTPLPWRNQITYGGTGNGGSNYTGSPSNYDNFSACVVNTTVTQTVAPLVNAASTDVSGGYELQAYPNPASSSVTLSYLPEQSGYASMRLFTSDGAQIDEFYHGFVEANKRLVRTLNTQKWAKGVYFVRLVLNDKIISRKLVISR